MDVSSGELSVNDGVWFLVFSGYSLTDYNNFSLLDCPTH